MTVHPTALTRLTDKAVLGGFVVALIFWHSWHDKWPSP